LLSELLHVCSLIYWLETLRLGTVVYAGELWVLGLLSRLIHLVESWLVLGSGILAAIL